ncbi:phage portal protein, HK97 family [Mesobacillus persicus]|uniref:Phage portal protein, HK97 family n=1 Tax=Mesobacillus persicus TaxID=930146 RepID=A0A1H7XMU9_9BACI|nr:phage portal protein [Mesobacillus persicus]SEM35005.1 phage portal protein, HK97 family [Mesobacillus persicus]
MGLLSKFFTQPKNAVSLNDFFKSVPNTNAGEVITNEGALNLSPIYAAVNLKANSLAKLPIHVYRKTEKGRERVYDHPVAQLLSGRVNPLMSTFTFVHLLQTHRGTEGVHYSRINTDRKGKVIGLYPLNPSRVDIVEDISGKIFYVESTKDGKTNVYNQEELLVITYLTTDGITPKSPIDVLRETAGLITAQDRYITSFYSQGTLTRGVLKIPTQLSKDAKDAVRRHWMEANSKGNEQKVAVLDSGMEFQNITLNLADQEFLASRKFSIEEIARAYNIPLHMLNSLESATFNNIEQMTMSFVMDTLMPEAIAIEQELNYKLFTPSEQKQGLYVKFNLSSAMRADSVARSQFYKTMIEAGIYSINEIRKFEEMNAIENGDKHYRSLNFIDIDSADEYQKAKAGVEQGSPKK